MKMRGDSEKIRRKMKKILVVLMSVLIAVMGLPAVMASGSPEVDVVITGIDLYSGSPARVEWPVSPCGTLWLGINIKNVGETTVEVEEDGVLFNDQGWTMQGIDIYDLIGDDRILLAWTDIPDAHPNDGEEAQIIATITLPPDIPIQTYDLEILYEVVGILESNHDTDSAFDVYVECLISPQPIPDECLTSYAYLQHALREMRTWDANIDEGYVDAKQEVDLTAYGYTTVSAQFALWALMVNCPCGCCRCSRCCKTCCPLPHIAEKHGDVLFVYRMGHYLNQEYGSIAPIPIVDCQPPQNKPCYPILEVGEQNPDETYPVTIIDAIVDCGSGMKKVVAMVDGDVEFEADDIGLPQYEFSFVVNLYPGTYTLIIDAWDYVDHDLHKERLLIVEDPLPSPPPKPPGVPGMTGWGIIASVVAVAGLMLVVVRRRGREMRE